MVFLAAVLFSFNFYLGTFKAVRALKFSINDFSFHIFNATHAQTTTSTLLNNTSPYEFQAFGIEQKVYVNYRYVGLAWIRDVSEFKPIRVPAKSSINATLTLTIYMDFLSPEIVELLLEPRSKTWQLSVVALLNGPMVGKFSLTASRSVNTF
jgi:hypothetical protein